VDWKIGSGEILSWSEFVTDLVVIPYLMYESKITADWRVVPMVGSLNDFIQVVYDFRVR